MKRLYRVLEKTMFQVPRVLNALLLIGGLVACGPSRVPTPQSSDSPHVATPAVYATPPLDGTEWLLISLRGDSLLPRSRITLDVTSARFVGFSGCNWYGGTYTADRHTLKLTEISSTTRDCDTPEGILDQEESYLNALRDVVSHQFARDTLRLNNRANETVLVFRRKQRLPMNPADLVGTRCRLQRLGGHPLIPRSRITLAFAEQTIRGFAGCRDYTGAFRAEGDNIRFPQLAMTQTGCDEPALLEQEGRYTTALSEATDYRLGAEQLQLYTAPGDTLIFVAEP